MRFKIGNLCTVYVLYSYFLRGSIGMSFSFKIWGRLIFGRSYFRKFIVNLGTVRRMFVIVGIHSTYGKEREITYKFILLFFRDINITEFL